MSESVGSEVDKGAAMEKMKKLAQKIYDTTPGINDCKSPLDKLLQLSTLLQNFQRKLQRFLPESNMKRRLARAGHKTSSTNVSRLLSLESRGSMDR